MDVDCYFAAHHGLGLIALPNAVRLVDTRPGTTAMRTADGLFAAGEVRTWKLTGVTFNGVEIPSTAVVLVATVTVVPDVPEASQA